MWHGRPFQAREVIMETMRYYNNHLEQGLSILMNGKILDLFRCSCLTEYFRDAQG